MTDSDFGQLLAELRPKLHRYCARMTGNVIDGEDVLQEAFVKAVRARALAEGVAQPERWLFRIAHNAALDFLRRQTRAQARQSNEDPETMVDPEDERPDPELLSTSLRTFMRLPTVQRSSVILMDVLGYSLSEIGAIMDASLPAVKSALHRGRTRLHELGKEPEDVPPAALSATERTLLAAYIDRFNARDYDAVRAMLAEEVRLDLVNRRDLRGKAEVQNYFSNYAIASPRRFALGLVDGHPSLLVYLAEAPRVVAYFVLLAWHDAAVLRIRDFLYAARTRSKAQRSSRFEACSVHLTDKQAFRSRIGRGHRYHNGRSTFSRHVALTVAPAIGLFALGRHQPMRIWLTRSAAISTALIALVLGGTRVGATDLGSAPSGQIPILFNDHHVYAKPDTLVDGRVLAALVKDGQIYVPLRSMFEQMGATVSASADGRTISAVKAGSRAFR